MILACLLSWFIGFSTGLYVKHIKIKRKKINLIERKNDVFNTWKTIDLVERYRDL